MSHARTSVRLLAFALAAAVLPACGPVEIDPEDSTPPVVTIKVLGPNGYQPASSVNYGNNTAQDPVKIMGIVEDPQGVKAYDLRVIDSTVHAAYCGGSVYSGSYQVGGLPSPVSQTFTGAQGTAPTQVPGIIEIKGILKLATNPPGVGGTCYPANNTKIRVRLRGTNWANQTSDATLDVHFKF